MSAKARRRRNRRHRRQGRAALKHGKSAKPKHALKAGRTGQVHTKRLKAGRCKKSERV